MKRFAVLMMLAGWSAAALADEPAFCKSMCSTEKTQCLAGIQAGADKEGLLATNAPEKNPFARTAQVQMRSSDGGALDKSGYEQRRMARAGACGDAYGRCVRSCNVAGGSVAGGSVAKVNVAGGRDAAGTVVSRHAAKPGP